MKTHIPKTDLVHGAYYKGECRNATLARWDAETQKFYHWREKFKHRFVEAIKCPEDDAKHDVFYAHELINVAHIPFTEDTEKANTKLCNECGALTAQRNELLEMLTDIRGRSAISGDLSLTRWMDEVIGKSEEGESGC